MTEFITTHICTLCDSEYMANPGYCDETIECAFDEGDHLVKIG